MNPQTKNCQNCKQDFTITPDDFSFYEKIKVPPPTWCPPCRFQRRMIFRNERKLFRNIDAVSGEAIISIFPPESSYPIYQDDFWAGDGWDPFSYGQEFDRSRPFLEQLGELIKKVPRPRSLTLANIRSDYTANASYMKDCYLLFNSNTTEDSAYGNAIDFSKQCFDCSHIQNSERCYESFWLTKCYDTHFSSLCEDCVSVWFSRDCRGCTNCFGCVNLRNKSYCFFNQQLSKEEYHEKLASLKISLWTELEQIKKEIGSFWLSFPVKYLQGVSNTDVIGEYITHSKNIRYGYLIREGEDSAYCQYGQVPPFKDCVDVTCFGAVTELQYDTVTSGWGSSQLKFCWECWDGGFDFEYCAYSGKNAKHLFGCVGVASGEYSILNRRYTKEEFIALREEIKKHMVDMPYRDAQGRVYSYGEFLPPEFSPFAYEDTMAIDHFPLSKEKIKAYGCRPQTAVKSEYETTIKSTDLPDDINDAEDTILKEIIECNDCKHAYRIISSELQFLRQNHIPLPRSCVDCRHTKRISQRNKSALYPRACDCNSSSKETVYKNETEHFHGNLPCPNTFETSYSPNRPEVIYCEKCYQQEVV